ncbi:hypothetical protein BpHYR1_047418 [Brachionus plicatilis]|uniref:Uncharacterized protein n=1 Tax=Brachionus plicatilis TaxID=10195 RepID=A0A3M7T1R5_BRAPC|nr:hypothetical protein BpHYR1_047418 [Brachionus plicatilis]
MFLQDQFVNEPKRELFSNTIFTRRKKNLKTKKSKKIFIQEKFFGFEIFFSSLKNLRSDLACGSTCLNSMRFFSLLKLLDEKLVNWVWPQSSCGCRHCL